MRERLDLAWRAARALPKLLELRPEARRTTADRIEECAARQPERAFLVFGESGEPRRLTYGELNRAANRVAHWALEQGLGRGDVVALLMENRPEYVVSWAGLAKAGVTAALINTHLSGRSLAHALAAAQTQTLICGTESLDHLASARDALERPLRVWLAHEPTGAAVPAAVPEGAGDLDAALEGCSDRNPPVGVRAGLRAGDDLFYIYTSGTTGLPKAARFSHLRFHFAGVGSAVLLRMDPEDVHYCALPLYHTAGGVMMVSTVLASGATLALRRRFSAGAFWNDCRRFGATRFQYIGEFCRYLLHQPPRDDDRQHDVRIILGNGLRPDVWERFQQRFGIEEIVEFYGSTEGNMQLVNLSGRPGPVGRIPVGPIARRLGNARLVRIDPEREEPLRDPHGHCIECDANEPGELLGRISKLAGRFEGYTSSEATEKKILRNVFEAGDAWFRSGDLLRRDRSGRLYFVDRIGDTFRWKGENVSTQEVAEVLGDFPGLELANVYGVPIEGMDGRAGMAALVVAGGCERFDPEAFYAFTTKRLPRYAAPLFVRLVREAEVTGTLKLKKVKLREEGFDLERISDPVFLRDDQASCYVPLTAQLRRALLSGERRV